MQMRSGKLRLNEVSCSGPMKHATSFNNNRIQGAGLTRANQGSAGIDPIMQIRAPYWPMNANGGGGGGGEEGGFPSVSGLAARAFI